MLVGHRSSPLLHQKVRCRIWRDIEFSFQQRGQSIEVLQCIRMPSVSHQCYDHTPMPFFAQIVDCDGTLCRMLLTYPPHGLALYRTPTTRQPAAIASSIDQESTNGLLR